MHKIIILFFSFILTLSITACFESSNELKNEKANKEVSNKITHAYENPEKLPEPSLF